MAVALLSLSNLWYMRLTWTRAFGQTADPYSLWVPLGQYELHSLGSSFQPIMFYAPCPYPDILYIYIVHVVYDWILINVYVLSLFLGCMPVLIVLTDPGLYIIS